MLFRCRSEDFAKLVYSEKCRGNTSVREGVAYQPKENHWEVA